MYNFVAYNQLIEGGGGEVFLLYFYFTYLRLENYTTCKYWTERLQLFGSITELISVLLACLMQKKLDIKESFKCNTVHIF